MTTIALLYFLGAAYLAGIGSAVAIFGVFVRASDGKHQSAGCFVQLTIGLCFGMGAYLLFEGWRLLVSA